MRRTHPLTYSGVGLRRSPLSHHTQSTCGTKEHDLGGASGNRLDDSVCDAVPNDFDTSADFLGRQREIGELVAALDDAMSGKGRLVMLVGEPGIGETRIAQELTAITEQRGAQVHWGRCYEGEGAPPY